MRHFILFIIVLLIAFLSVQNSYMFSKTRKGEPYGYFKTVNSQYIPSILANYLRESGVRYSVYKIPNFVIDFLERNNDFSAVYASKPKFSVLIFAPEKKVQENISNFQSFYSKVKEQVNIYPESFNLIVYAENRGADYRLKYDKDAYNELIKYCGAFCLIDPSRNMMFVFNKITNTEKESLEILFQQYSFINK